MTDTKSLLLSLRNVTLLRNKLAKDAGFLLVCGFLESSRKEVEGEIEIDVDIHNDDERYQDKSIVESIRYQFLDSEHSEKDGAFNYYVLLTWDKGQFDNSGNCEIAPGWEPADSLFELVV